MKEYLLAHDLGTSGDKATLFTTEGELVDSEIESYPVHYYNGNWAEQDAEDWWNAFCASTRKLLEYWHHERKNQVPQVPIHCHAHQAIYVAGPHVKGKQRHIPGADRGTSHSSEYDRV